MPVSIYYFLTESAYGLGPLEQWDREFESRSRKAQKSHGARSGPYGGCSDGVPLINFYPAEHRINSDLALCDFWAFPTMKGSSEARNFEVIKSLQQVFDKWVERCKKYIACQGRYSEKETVTAPPQISDSE
jgi:hypothetical protein